MIIKRLALAVLMTFALTAQANASVWEFSFNTIASWDAEGDSNNTIVTVDLAAALGFAPGSAVFIDAIGWDVMINPQGASWYSEATVAFRDSSNDPTRPAVILSPGAGDDVTNDGAPRAYSSGGLIDLTDSGLADIMLLSDGILVMEFFEGFDDVPDAVDAFWSGTLSVNAQVVPVPAALPLLLSALGLTGFLTRRRG